MNLSRLSLHVVLWGLFSPVAAGDQPDQPQAPCPTECNLSNLHQITEKIIDGEASLDKGSCKKRISSEGKTDISFKYVWDMRIQQSQIQGGPTGIPPMPNITHPEKHGWYIETNNGVKLGQCLTLPNNLKGPFPQDNVTTCIHNIEFACYRLSCPCFDESRINNLNQLLRRKPQDDGFVLQLERSCKDPKMNDGRPFGLYSKKTQMNTWDDDGVVSIAVDMNFGHNQKNQCYDGDARHRDLNPSQHQNCINLVQSLCDELKTLRKTSNPLCQDNPAFRYKGKAQKTCEFLTSDSLTKQEINRNCNKFDVDSKKFVFQQCRESCRSCSCSDNIDFYYNGQADYNCTWIGNLPRDQKKDLCTRDIDVSTNCPTACNSKCCKDRPNFKFWVRRHGSNGRKNHYQKMKCNDIGQHEWEEICKRKKVAARCPMKCRRCPIMPRNAM